MKRMGLKRISELYGLLERTRAMELGVAAAAVAEVDSAGAVEDGVRREQAGAGYAALLAGDQTGWALSKARREAAEVRVRRLGMIRVEREAAWDAARDTYRESRMQMEQVESAMERTRVLEEMEAARRMQAATDDRYLSRRAWMRGEDARREQGGGLGGPAGLGSVKAR